jgi:hypothetical protein
LVRRENQTIRLINSNILLSITIFFLNKPNIHLTMKRQSTNLNIRKENKSKEL